MTLQPQTKPLTYISIFSGIEAASVAWEPLGFQPLAFAEVDPFPAAVLKERYPHVPNLGDVTKIDWSDYHGKADIVVGGSPCQSFSVAGKREGLKGESGLMFEYIRCVREVRPSLFVWENVPGALSSEGGAAFGQLLSEMDDLGYGLAWRVLDAQFTGVAQRRRRVFLVGCLGDPERAAEILFEPDSLRWDHPPSKQKREELARAARTSARPTGAGTSISGNIIGRADKNGGNQVGINDENVSYTLTTSGVPAVCSHAGPLNPWDNQTSRVYHAGGIAPTLMSNNTGGFKGGFVLDQPKSSAGFIYHGSADARGIGFEEEQSPTVTSLGKPPAVAFAQNTRDEVRLINGDGSLSGCLAAQTGAKQQTYVMTQKDNEGVSGHPADPAAYTLLVRCGKEGGGKGALVQTELSATLSTSNMQTLFQQVHPEPSSNDHLASCLTQYGEELAGTLTASHDSSPCTDRGQNVVCLASGMAHAEMLEDCCSTQTARQHKDPPIVFSKTYRGHYPGDAETWANTGLSNTLNTYDVGEKRCNELVVEESRVVCMGDDNAKASIDDNLSGTLKCGGSAPVLTATNPTDYRQSQTDVGAEAEPDWIVRRLTPLECERLQGFPDNWTRIPWKGKAEDQCPDTPRYKAAGNSMAVPVMRWIAQRIAKTGARGRCSVQKKTNPSSKKCPKN